MGMVWLNVSLTLFLYFARVTSDNALAIANDSANMVNDYPSDNDLDNDYHSDHPSNYVSEDYTYRLKQTHSWIPTNPDPPLPPYDYQCGFADAIEKKLCYFREDMALNSHHLHYHNANPFEWTEEDGKYIDRKGEMFLYVHQQILARYDIARLAIDLERTVPYSNLRKPIKEGYFPGFPHLTARADYPGRPENMLLADTTGIFGETSVAQLEMWREEILQAIQHGFAFDEKYEKVPLRNDNGADILGAILQSSTSSVNNNLYGNLHNMGHDLLGRICDPNGNLEISSGILEKATTTTRDPLFFRWHKEIDDIFEVHRMLMDPYRRKELSWNQVHIDGISIEGDITKSINELTTYTERVSVYLRAGFDFESPFPVNVTLQISQHEEYNVYLNVTVRGNEHVHGVVRLFLAPVLDHNGKYIPLQEQRRLFVELDKRVVKLKPGENQIRLRSEDSAVIRTTEATFERLSYITTEMMSVEEGHMGCGLPQHLLIPRGREEGMRFTLFAMISDWKKDKVADDPKLISKPGASYCGVFNEKYPDKRNMGFPFDRRMEDSITLTEFLTKNMAITELTVFFSKQIVPQRQPMDPHYVTATEKLFNSVKNFVYNALG